MIREDIIRIAREAGLKDVLGSWCQECGCNDEMLLRFAELVVDRAAAEEREACAKVCDSFVDLAEAEKAKLRIDYARTAGDEEDELRAMRHELIVSTFNAGISKCEAAIRARGQQ